MRCILSDITDPYFNLASEEYLLKHFDEDLFLLYRNEPSIVVGKHQNTLAEINLEYVLEKDLKVARRISGGGTVFHDLGNLNFAFITNEREGYLVDYEKFTRPVIEAMAEMGLKVTLGSRNELLLGGKKITGTASHVYKHRVLHHGTLLFSSVMGDLSHALKSDAGFFRDKAVRSVRSRVTNIRDHLQQPMEVNEFRDILYRYVLRTVPGARPYVLSRDDLEAIHTLRREKFSTWKWNFGYSPRYQFHKEVMTGIGRLSVEMNVEKGEIRELRIRGDFEGTRKITGLECSLAGTIHDPETLRLRLEDIPLGEYMKGVEKEELVRCMF